MSDHALVKLLNTSQTVPELGPVGGPWTVSRMSGWHHAQHFSNTPGTQDEYVASHVPLARRAGVCHEVSVAE